MIALPNRKIATRPTGFAELNRSNPLTDGCTYLANFDSHAPFDVVGKSLGIPAGAITTSVGALGLAADITTSDSANRIQISSSVDAIVPLDRVTIVVIRQKKDTTLRTCTNWGSSSDFGGTAPYSDGLLYWEFGAPNTTSSGLTWDTRVDHLIYIAGTQKGREVWRNGIRIAKTSDTNARSSDTNPFYVGSYGAFASDIEYVYLFGVFDREWTDEQCISWSQNPWQLFRPQSPYIYLPDVLDNQVSIPTKTITFTANAITADSGGNDVNISTPTITFTANAPTASVRTDSVGHLSAAYDLLAYDTGTIHLTASYDLTAYRSEVGHVSGSYDYLSYRSETGHGSASYDLLAYQPQLGHLQAAYDLFAYQPRFGHLNAAYDLLIYRTVTGQLSGSYDVLSYSTQLGYLNGSYDVLAYVPKTGHLGGAFDVLAYRSSIGHLSAAYDQLAYRAVTGQLSGAYDLLSYRSEIGALSAAYDVLAYVPQLGSLSASYDILAYLNSTGHLHAAYDIRAYEARTGHLSSAYDLLAYAARLGHLSGSYDLSVYSRLRGHLNGAYDLNTFIPSLGHLNASYDLRAYQAKTGHLTGAYDCLAYQDVVGHLNSSYNILCLKSASGHLNGSYDVLAYRPVLGHLSAAYDLLTYRQRVGHLSGAYDVLAYRELTAHLSAAYDLLAYQSRAGHLTGSYDLQVYQQLAGHLTAAYDLLANEVFYGWAMNLDTGAVSKYEGFNFNSLSGSFGCAADGIYTMGGSTDNGAAITGFVLTGVSDFGAQELKNVSDAYVSQNGGKVTLTVIADGQSIPYEMRLVTTQQTVKANLARGVKDRYWQFKLANVAGSSATVLDVDVNVQKLTRRI
jgi:hypothetical protein